MGDTAKGDPGKLEQTTNIVEDPTPGSEELVDGIPDAVPDAVVEGIYWALDIMEYAGVNPVAIVVIIFLSQYIKQFIKKTGRRRALSPAIITAVMSFGLAKNPAFYERGVPSALSEYAEVWVQVFLTHLAAVLLLYGLFKSQLKKRLPSFFDPAATVVDAVSAIEDPDPPKEKEGPGLKTMVEAKLDDAVTKKLREVMGEINASDEPKAEEPKGDGVLTCISCGKDLLKIEEVVCGVCKV